MKRFFDISAALAGLLVLSPLLAAIALAIWLADRHSPFYLGIRRARGGAEFRMLKFRTMIPGAWKSGVYATASNDPRITRIGRWLRAAKLDELPQLWNVLAGDMSLVGPRPQVPSEAEFFTAEERRLFEIRPGITDLASLIFSNESALLRGAPDPDLLTQQILRPWKSRLALAYRDHGGDLRSDLRLLGLTLLAAFSPERARAGAARLLTQWQADPLLFTVLRRLGSGQPPPAWPPPGGSAIAGVVQAAAASAPASFEGSRR
jgi:lipopolysaccharide/colanic/teichoic acid biosynthesis glycosyltransferase